jgi:hypothetical protein
MANEVTVFFYGLFMDPQALEARGFRPTNVRRVFVDDLALQLGERATLVPAIGSRTFGMLMKLTHDEIDALYSEQSVAAYRPEPVVAHLIDGGAEPALCFNLPSVREKTTTNRDYATALKAVATKMGLPEQYVAGIGD